MVMFAIFITNAAQAKDLHTLIAKANHAWELKQYPRSQAIFERVVNVYGKRAKKGVFGSQFGMIYYRKGLTELKLGNTARRDGNEAEAKKWFNHAKESFRICYEDFPN